MNDIKTSAKIENKVQNAHLSSVERSIVLSSLSNGRIPISIDSDCGLPATVEAGKLTVLDNGVILVSRPTPDVAAFAGEVVTVRFEWNGVPVFFQSEMKKVRAGIAFVAPAVMSRAFVPQKERVKSEEKRISATLFLEREEETDGVRFMNKRALLCSVFEHFLTDFSGLSEEETDLARSFLPKGWEKDEAIIALSRALLFDMQKKENEQSEVFIPFLDKNRVCLCSFDSELLPLFEGDEVAFELRFPLPHPLKERKIAISITVVRVLEKAENEKPTALGALCRISSARMEDVRFLSDYFK